ncbi:hypothetical protein [Marinobacterium jannaschii]|uniref:hypothetical protein n=1 Tax=Marinobacterium jannaschii TaxID=64970 RepID=UPI0012EC28D2|nr:hypothetical protein [Marinobacterium jannaschii]
MIEFEGIPMAVEDALSPAGLLPQIVVGMISSHAETGSTDKFRFSINESGAEATDNLSHMIIVAPEPDENTMPFGTALVHATHTLRQVLNQYRAYNGTDISVIPDTALFSILPELPEQTVA